MSESSYRAGVEGRQPGLFWNNRDDRDYRRGRKAGIRNSDLVAKLRGRTRSRFAPSDSSDPDEMMLARFRPGILANGWVFHPIAAVLSAVFLYANIYLLQYIGTAMNTVAMYSLSWWVLGACFAGLALAGVFVAMYALMWAIALGIGYGVVYGVIWLVKYFLAHPS